MTVLISVCSSAVEYLIRSCFFLRLFSDQILLIVVFVLIVDLVSLLFKLFRVVARAPFASVTLSLSLQYNNTTSRLISTYKNTTIRLISIYTIQQADWSRPMYNRQINGITLSLRLQLLYNTQINQITPLNCLNHWTPRLFHSHSPKNCGTLWNFPAFEMPLAPYTKIATTPLNLIYENIFLRPSIFFLIIIQNSQAPLFSR